jgi:hypothetical protein
VRGWAALDVLLAVTCVLSAVVLGLGIAEAVRSWS